MGSKSCAGSLMIPRWRSDSPLRFVLSSLATVLFFQASEELEDGSL